MKNESSEPNIERNKSQIVKQDLEIREMVLEDLPAVFALGERLFTAEKWPNLYRTWEEYNLISLFASDGEFCLVAELDGQLTGFALGSLIAKRRSAWSYGYLEWLGVAPEWKGSGIAKKLLNELTELFIAEGARMLMVDTELDNREALQFFKRQGFGNPVEHIYLSRNLSNHPQYVRRREEIARGKNRRADVAEKQVKPSAKQHKLENGND